ncbi:MAG: hypothetical protein RIQ60_1290 [Pseudomonadota bacterium]|jgi:hypothetical protein
MLRGLAVLLLLVNLLIFGWNEGWLASVVDASPDGDREPRRVNQQINPEAVKVITPATLARLQSQTECLEAGPFSSAELVQMDTLARSALPEGSWSLVTRERPGSWLIYMGRFPNHDVLQRKADELRRLNVTFDELRAPAELLPGLVLGRYGRLDEAQDNLRRLAERRVRSAKIVQLAAPIVSHHLRMPKADAVLQASAASLREQLLGKPFVACDK